MPKGFGNMFRYVVLIFSVIMLLVTFNSPASDWPINLNVLGYRIRSNVFYWLFMTSVIAYIPLTIGGATLFFYDLFQLFKNKRRRHAVNLIVFSTATLVALYRFNGWIFGEIF